MEDVLEVYHRPYGDNEVLVCLDETSKQQTKETRLPRPARPGASGVYDYEAEETARVLLEKLSSPAWRAPRFGHALDTPQRCRAASDIRYDINKLGTAGVNSSL